MSQFQYPDGRYPIRQDVKDAHRAVWRFVAQPGVAWTGAQKVALAQAARDAHDCPLCADRKASLSPFAGSGEHAGLAAEHAGIPDVAIDAAHRIVTDASRLSQSWLQGLIGADFGYSHYVELVAIVSALQTVDTMHRALGMPLERLPAPVAGTASGYQPDGARIDSGWVPMLSPETLAQPEADLFLGRPAAANVVRALSLVPDSVRLLHVLLDSHYLPLSQLLDHSATGALRLSRPQIELVASRTSLLNGCFYCTSAHALMLERSSQQAGQTVSLGVVSGARAADSGIELDGALVRFVDAVKQRGGDLEEVRRELEVASDADTVVDVASVIATFERMNRIADATGIVVDAGMLPAIDRLQAELGIVPDAVAPASSSDDFKET